MVENKKYTLISEENYEEAMTNTVEPFLRKLRTDGFMKLSDGRRIHYEYYITENAKASIVIVHGYTEMAEKFREMMYYFICNEYNVFALDHMGHGYSSRQTDDPNLAHIESFDMYADDLNSFVEEIVKPNSASLPLYIFSHSMGGAISVLHMQRFPGVFEKAVLSAPMILPKTAGIPQKITKIMTKFFTLIGKGGEMVFTEHPFNPDRTYLESGDTSKARFDYVHGIRKKHIEYRTCATTYRWLDEALRISKELVNKKKCEKITAKVFIFQAENDSMVEPMAQVKFMYRVKDAVLMRVMNTKHELYLSEDDVMEKYLRMIFDFLEE